MSFLALRPAVIALAAGVAWAPAAESATSSNSSEVLALLHDGRFDAAERRAAGAASGTDLEALFLDAFVYYWRLLYDERNAALQTAFDARLGRTITLADQRLARNPKDPEAALWGGTAHLLRGQLLGRQKKAMAAASEAKRSRKLLLLSPSADALFGLGSYNYLTDQLQGAARGLRAILGIPPGDREEGLRQLERAAREAEHLRLEARLLLMSMYAGKRERRYDEALRQADRLVREHGSAVVALDAAARTELSVGRPDRAAALLDRALAQGGADPSVTATLRVHRARCELARFRPDRAEEWLAPLANPAAVPASLRDELKEAAAAARSIPSASWQRVSAGAGLPQEEAARALAEVARAHPEDAVAALYAGRALLLAGRAGDALPLLVRAEGSGRLAAPWVGPSRLLAGQAADLLGQRAQAVAWYRKALESPEWVGRDAPRRWLDRPYRGAA
jgi:hypothetical protein